MRYPPVPPYTTLVVFFIAHTLHLGGSWLTQNLPLSDSLADPLDIPRYRNAAHAAFTIVREEGLATLYRGVTLTALRQATNQGVNFTAYQQFKKWALEFQPKYQETGALPSAQTMVIGLISGAMGPFSNAPIDTIKT